MDKKKLNRLKLVLVEKDKTGVWLAEQLGVTAVTVSKWCSNITQPTLPTPTFSVSSSKQIIHRLYYRLVVSI